jgi:prevent-host-death family protein
MTAEPIRFNMHEAKTHLSRIMERVEAGEEVIISRAGKPVARVVPIHPSGPGREPGSLRGRIRISADFDAPLPAEIAAAFGGDRR